MQITERLPKETAREYATRMLKENIVSLQLAPGTLLSENELARELGLSRTPVREALIELSKAHLVEILPQHGSRISLIDYTVVEDVRFMRLVLECAVVELLCAQSDTLDFSALEENLHLQDYYLQSNTPDAKKKLWELDNSFHEGLFTLAHKLQTYSILENMATHFDRVRVLSLAVVAENRIVHDHRSILQAVEAGNTDKARACMTEHLSRFRIDKETIEKAYPGYFVQAG